jgi:cardiolipin synthase
MAASEKPGNWTVPNALTVARILFTPLFVAFFLDQDYLAALSVFILAGLTDALDGFLAKLLDQRSRLGAMLDPLADKVLLDSCYICLSSAGWLPTWLTVTVVSRDVIILGGLALLAFWGQDMRDRIAPSLVSKLTTIAQMILVLVSLMHWLAMWGTSLEDLLDVLAVLTAALTVISGAHYVWKGLTLFVSPTGEGDHPPKGRS